MSLRGCVERHFGFTGTQGPLAVPQATSLGEAFGALEHDGFVWQHNGDCIGADAFAARLWRDIGGKIHLHPPGIDAKRAFCLNPEASEHPKPYRDRNQDIVNSGELLVGCPKTMEEELRSGTWMTIRMARRLGIPCTIVWPNGYIDWEV